MFLACAAVFTDVAFLTEPGAFAGVGAFVGEVVSKVKATAAVSKGRATVTARAGVDEVRDRSFEDQQTSLSKRSNAARQTICGRRTHALPL